MITIFNRRELITTVPQKKLFKIREALFSAGVSSYTKTRGLGASAASRARGMVPPAVQDYALTYTIYVRKEDYDRALVAIQPVLRGQ
ncbi:hypothetical protein [uncultured Dysosmobacter sp.]|uniref:hypothetical protein n=1 Tax=uncultured Dysosmobacter sp. TaxID=2591384 RepID=UPI002609BE8F|nr:hypothetical protein [uncultured Dysosmobacter sp.]